MAGINIWGIPGPRGGAGSVGIGGTPGAPGAGAAGGMGIGGGAAGSPAGGGLGIPGAAPGVHLMVGHAILNISNATINVTRATINTSGGGAGGGGRGGGGGGFGLPGGGAFSNQSFLGMAANAGIAALGMTSLIWVAGTIVRDIIRAPQWMGMLWQGALSAAAPYIRVAVPAYAQARAGGFGGSDLVRSLAPGGNVTPDWMRVLGVTPEAALESISRLGVVPRSAGEAARAAQTSALFGLAPGFAGMQAGTVEKIGAQGLAFGSTSMGGLPAYLQAFGNVMDNATSRGLDRSRILSSIQDTLEVIARSGAPTMGGVGGMLDLFSKISGLGSPGARTGALQQSVETGLTATMQNPLGSPMTTMTAIQTAQRFNNFKTRGDIERFMGLSPGEVPQGMPKAVWDDNVRRITEGGRSNPVFGAMLALQLGSGTEAGRANIAKTAERLTSGLSSSVQPFAMKGFTGLDLSGSLAVLQAPLVPPSGATGSPTANAVSGMQDAIKIAQGTMPLPTGFDRTQDYATLLKRAGIRSDLIPMLIASGQRNNVSPLVLAAIGEQESGMDPTLAHINRRVGSKGSIVSTDYGLMGINSTNLKAFGLTTQTAFDPAKNIEAGAEFLAQRGLDKYNPGMATYQSDIARRVALLMAPNLPSDILSAQARAAQAEFFGGKASMATFVPAVGAVSDAFTSLISAIQSVVSALSRMQASAAGEFHGPNVQTAPAQ